jgi:hypothetical protein
MRGKAIDGFITVIFDWDIIEAYVKSLGISRDYLDDVDYLVIGHKLKQTRLVADKLAVSHYKLKKYADTKQYFAFCYHA